MYEIKTEDFRIGFYDSDDDCLGAITMAVLYLTSLDVKLEEVTVRDMSSYVKNFVNTLVTQMEAHLKELARCDEMTDEEGFYVEPLLDATELLLMRDRLEDLRIFNSEFFANEEILQLKTFDELLDRADLYLQDMRDARVNLGERTGHPNRRWWSPKY